MALSADSVRPFETAGVNTFPVRASTTIYKGSACGDDGAGRSRALVAGDRFQGFAIAKADNASGGSGAINVDVITNGLVQGTLTSVALTDVGKPVYMSDDDTFTLTQGSNSFVGYVYRYVAANTCIIAFGDRAGAYSVAGAGTTLDSGKILVGNASNVAAARTPSGDVTINNSGVTAIGAAKVLTAMISAAQVTATELGTAAVTSTKISDATITIAKIESVCLSTLISYGASSATSAVTSHKTSSAH